MGKSAIEWTDETWNPIIGCSRVSEGCRHCYAEQAAAGIVRKAKGKPNVYDDTVRLVRRPASPASPSLASDHEPRWTGVVKLLPERLAQPLGWKKPRRVFVNSMSDLFHESLTNEQIAAVFGVMAVAPRHTFQVLTKRAKRMRKWFEWVSDHGSQGARAACRVSASSYLGRPVESTIPPVGGFPWPLSNIWLGVSIENQPAADERIPHLLATPAAVRFLSCEPLLGPVDVSPWIDYCELLDKHGISRDEAGRHIKCEHHCGISWVIAGCESGPGARDCDVSALLSLREQCEAAGVRFFAKQWRRVSGVVEAREDSHVKPGGVIGAPYLDGVQHLEFPR